MEQGRREKSGQEAKKENEDARIWERKGRCLGTGAGARGRRRNTGGTNGRERLDKTERLREKDRRTSTQGRKSQSAKCVDMQVAASGAAGRQRRDAQAGESGDGSAQKRSERALRAKEIAERRRGPRPQGAASGATESGRRRRRCAARPGGGRHGQNADDGGEGRRQAPERTHDARRHRGHHVHEQGGRRAPRTDRATGRADDGRHGRRDDSQAGEARAGRDARRREDEDRPDRGAETPTLPGARTDARRGAESASEPARVTAGARPGVCADTAQRWKAGRREGAGEPEKRQVDGRAIARRGGDLPGPGRTGDPVHIRGTVRRRASDGGGERAQAGGGKDERRMSVPRLPAGLHDRSGRRDHRVAGALGGRQEGKPAEGMEEGRTAEIRRRHEVETAHASSDGNPARGDGLRAVRGRARRRKGLGHRRR